jgi:flagellar motility protein MotE (MotC chaperone)
MRVPAVSLRVPTPRLLPLTILAMAALLGVKSVALVRAAAPSATQAAPADQPPKVAAAPVTPVAESKPADAKPAPMAAEGASSGNTKVGDSKPGDAAPGDAKPSDTAPAPAIPPISDSERSLLLDLRQRSMELDKRDAALAAREGMLAAAEARLAARLAELGGLQKRLEALDATRKEHDEANWKGLVKLYESMKPKDAAAIFNDLDLPVLLPVLDRMKEQKAALVMAAMLPERARLVTAELAQMRARANTVPPPPATAGAGVTTAPPGKPAGG